MIARLSKGALGGALVFPWLLCAGAAAAPAPPLPGNCVAALRAVHSGSGDKSFSSQYVFSGDFAYGEWVAGVARGQSLWRRRGATWCKIQTGIADLDEQRIESFGVDPADARRLAAAPWTPRGKKNR